MTARARLSALLDKAYRRIFENVYGEPASLEVERALLTLASHSGVQRLAPGASGKALALRRARDEKGREAALLELYLLLHRAGAGYSGPEEARLRAGRGVGFIPGGLAPLLLAGHLLEPSFQVADLGAANGLQGLLLQSIAPHRKTLQVELSGQMARTGRLYREALGMDPGRVEWFHGDILDAPLEETDLVYLYRPVRPVGEGNDFYRALAGRLSETRRIRYVLSVADCLERHLEGRFPVLYRNDDMTVFVRAS